MIDESKRKKIMYASIVFGILVIMSLVGFFVFNKKENLPPIDSDSSEASKSTESTEDTSKDEPSVFKNNIEFKKFNALSQATITDSRIDVVRYYLAEHASTQSTGVINAYTLDTNSIKTSQEGELQIYTFTVRDNNDTQYSVELSYVYATDAFVHIYDKDGHLLQTSPSEDHSHED